MTISGSQRVITSRWQRWKARVAAAIKFLRADHAIVVISKSSPAPDGSERTVFASELQVFGMPMPMAVDILADMISDLRRDQQAQNNHAGMPAELRELLSSLGGKLQDFKKSQDPGASTNPFLQ